MLEWITSEGPIMPGVRFAVCGHSRGRVELEIHPDEPQIVRFRLTTFAAIEEAGRRLELMSDAIECERVRSPKKPRRRAGGGAPAKRRKQA